MSAESALYPVLSPLAAVYPGACTAEPPPNTYIVYQRVSSVPTNTLAGDAPGLTHVRMQIDAYARSYPAALALAASIRTAMYAAVFKNYQDNEQDMYEAEVKYFRVLQDWMIWQ